ncbi:MAG: glycosyltransferase family 9 protein [Candidatus Margulisiibacteriota bacterium]
MNKILIVKLAAIGDVLRTTSLLPGLEKKYPGVEIDWVTSKPGKEILINNPLIRKIFIWEERGEVEKYDLVIGLEDDLEAAEFVSSVKAENIIGAYLKNGKVIYTPSAWFDMSLISKYGREEANKLKKLNRKTFQQHMADLLGIEVGAYVFNLTSDEIEYGREIVRGLGVGSRERIIGINTGAGRRWPQKSWGKTQTIELIKRIKNELGYVSIILGGEDEKERNKIIAKETGMPEAGVHSLRHFASIINQCDLILTSDSLAMHFAIAERRRIVAFFGPTSAAEIELYGLGDKISSPMNCLACYKKECDIMPSCMDNLSVNEVFDALANNLMRRRK